MALTDGKMRSMLAAVVLGIAVFTLLPVGRAAHGSSWESFT
jgi:hypothetical protein